MRGESLQVDEHSSTKSLGVKDHTSTGRLKVGGQTESGSLKVAGNTDTNDLNVTVKTTTRALDVNGASVLNGTLKVAKEAYAPHLYLHDPNAPAQTRIHLDGERGDIMLGNADCTEEFDVADGQAEPGTVMVLGAGGALMAAQGANDRRMAGVISGAGAYRPAIVLDRQKSDPQSPRAPLALVGKIYCKVDATHGAVAAGDLLTTSPTKGHAMVPRDAQQAFGAILGKALALILVTHYLTGLPMDFSISHPACHKVATCVT
jgi:hypothetical protein